ncbi:prepilin-type N-terminal cleavage/methylation domain-containing protein [bacterium]|jgi:hypothetical protein|nr:prepilin-type N-terminal cleavage/methylation domain-containing protein [bacterium]
MRRGFVLIDVILAITIFSVISAMLFSVFFQTNNIFERIDSLISCHIKGTTLSMVLKRDFSGVFIPMYSEPSKEQKHPGPPKKDEQKKDGSDEKEWPEPENVFLFKKGEGKPFDFLTFITSNPIEAFGVSKPRVARIVYLMDKRDDGTFKFRRFESDKLEFDVEKVPGEYKDKSFVVVEKINNFSIKFGVFALPKRDDDKKQAEEKKDKKDKKKENKPVDLQYKTYNVWPLDDEQKDDKLDLDQKIPNCVECEFMLYDDDKKFYMVVPMYAATPFVQINSTKTVPKKADDVKAIENVKNMINKQTGDKDKNDKEKNAQGASVG